MALRDEDEEEAESADASATTTAGAENTAQPPPPLTISSTAEAKISKKDTNSQNASHKKPETALSDYFPSSVDTSPDGDSGLGTGTDESGVANLSYPVAASDYYTGPSGAAPGLYPLSSTADGTRAVRMTSLEGSNGLDPLSVTTVCNKFAKLSHTPQLDLVDEPLPDRPDKNNVADVEYLPDCSDDRQADDEPMSHLHMEHNVARDEPSMDSFGLKQNEVKPECFEINFDDVLEPLMPDSFVPNQTGSDDRVNPKYHVAKQLLDRSYPEHDFVDVKAMVDLRERDCCEKYVDGNLTILTEPEDDNGISEVSLQASSFNDEQPGSTIREQGTEGKHTNTDEGLLCKNSKKRGADEDDRKSIVVDSVPTHYRQLSQFEIHKAQVAAGMGEDPVFPENILKSNRLASFPNPAMLSGLHVDADEMASNGFFVPPVIGCKCVTCYQCGSSLYHWEAGMTAGIEHTMLAPRCPAIRP